MQIIRFYALDGVQLEPLAKYNTDTDKTAEEIKNICRDIVAGAHSSPDAYDFFNAKFAILDKTLADAGFARMPMVDAGNLDAKCSLTFDIVVNVDARSVKILTFKVKPCADEPGYLKDLDDTYVLGQIVQ